MTLCLMTLKGEDRWWEETIASRVCEGLLKIVIKLGSLLCS